MVQNKIGDVLKNKNDGETKAEPTIEKIASCDCGSSDFDIVYVTMTDGKDYYLTGDWRLSKDPIDDWRCILHKTIAQANDIMSDWNLGYNEEPCQITDLVEWDTIDTTHDFRQDVFLVSRQSENESELSKQKSIGI